MRGLICQGVYFLDNDLLRFVCLRHWLRVSRLFNRKTQSLGLAWHPRVTIVVFAKIVARRFDAHDALLQETPEEGEFCRKHCRARGIADRLRRPERAKEDARLLLTRLNYVRGESCV